MRAKYRQLYKITITNWETHNKGHRKSFKKTMIANNFCHDSRLSVVPVTVRWMYLACLLECGSSARACIVMSERQLRDCLESSKSVSRALESLQSLQLLTWELLPVDLNTKEVNEGRKERISAAGRTDPPAQLPLLKPPDKLHQLAELWNQNCGQLPKVKTTVNGRMRCARARWPDRTPEEWILIIERIRASDFCNGKNQRGWKADFDFLVRPDTWTKVIEGKYDNRKPVHDVDINRRVADAF